MLCWISRFFGGNRPTVKHLVGLVTAAKATGGTVRQAGCQAPEGRWKLIQPLPSRTGSRDGSAPTCRREGNRGSLGPHQAASAPVVLRRADASGLGGGGGPGRQDRFARLQVDGLR